MGPQKEITIREADLGPVIARADHQDGAIEVNSEIFYELPPMVQEFVLCHEVCHLKHNEWDEQRTNQLASELFVSRATGIEDRKRRGEFLSYLNGNGGYSNFDVAAIIAAATAAIGLGTTIYTTIRDRNALWYSWSDAVKRANLQIMLSNAFEESRKTSRESASQIFWQQMYSYTNKDNDLEGFLARDENSWVLPVIRKYETAYGFGFEEVTPIDLTAFPALIIAIGAIVGYLIYKLIKNHKK